MSQTDQRLLSELASSIRERESDLLEIELEQFVRGELSANERAALSERASSDPHLAQRLLLYTPLPSTLRSQIAEQLLKGDVAPPQPVRLRPVRSGRQLAYGLVLAAAAASLLVFMRGAPAPLALPEYGMTFSTISATHRGGSEVNASRSPVRLEPTTRLRILLRPATPTRAPVHAVAYLVSAHGTRDWPGSCRLSPHGAVELQLGAPPAPLTAGEYASAIVEITSDAGALTAGTVRQRWSIPLLGAAEGSAP